MEIERKFTIKELPDNLEQFPHHIIEQAYLNTDPVIRIRKQDEAYFLTYKGKGLMAREEYNLFLNETSYYHLLQKADGNVISKTRYVIPLENPKFSVEYSAPENTSLVIELDIFESPFAPLVMAEVEFPSVEMANAFIPPEWFLEDVTNNCAYHNSNMSKQVFQP